MFQAVVAPLLYSHLVLGIPRGCSHLSRLENLVASTGDGLQFVTSLRIRVAADTYLETQACKTARFSGQLCAPDEKRIGSLNTLMRILLKRLRKHRLTEFMSVTPPSLL